MEAQVQSIEYLIHHLFLPPQLPQKNDWTPHSHTKIIQLVLESIDGFISRMGDPNAVHVWEMLRRMVENMASTRIGSSLDAHTLENVMLGMQPNGVLCLHVVAQNAGVILRESPGETMFFEVFQVSPPAAKVTSTIGKLVMTFPSMPRLAFPKNKQCITAFCRILSWLDRTKMDDAMAKTRKAGSEVNENREVSDIHYLSQMLGSILAAATTPNLHDTENSTVYVTKRINDHALWSNADLPWRRMPEWLILRVALQTSLQIAGIGANSQFGYKSFITYLLAMVLEKACSSGINHELLHVMNVKIAGRMWKLRETVNNGPVFDFVSNQVKRSRCILQERWDNIQAKEKLPLRLSPPSVHDIIYACHFRFPQCGDYLSRLYNRHSTLNINTNFDIVTFERNLHPMLTRTSGSSPPEALSGTFERPEFWLAFLDIERWVADQMQHWQNDIQPASQIDILRKYIKDFLKFIDMTRNPEIFSRLYLVVLELWVALDRAAIRISPLLQDYSPEIEVRSFEPLLLPQLSQMRRLHQVEQYIQDRHSRVRHHTSIFNFEAEDSETSFAYRYYLNDHRLQNLCSEIREKANDEKEAKLKHWEELRKRFQDLTSQSDSLPHSNYTNWRGKTRHGRHCRKCQLKKDASSLSIDIYEWPLPEDTVLEGMVVFELSPPEWFTVWRTVTYDIAKIRNESVAAEQMPTVILHNYRPLARDPTTGITIASYDAKPWYDTHYSSILIKDANFELDFIKRHPLRYQLYHPERKQWITSFPEASLRDACTPVLPSGVYSNLSWALRSTTHTSNMVIAKQSDCHRSLTYHEWASFGHLRAGGRLQWRNILIELLKGVGTFKDPAWFILLRQAVWQIECQGTDEYRDFHSDLINNSFAMEALEVLSGVFDSICKNWQEGWTAMSLVMLACRIHSLNTDVHIRTGALKLLSRLREACLSWLEDVRKSYLREDSETDPKSKKDLLFRLIQIAICCRSTYALEREELEPLFAQDPNAFKIFITASIAIQDFLPGSLDDVPSTLKYIIQKDFVQAAEIFTYLMSEEGWIDLSGFRNAVRAYWESFSPDPNSWVITHGCWLCCCTLAEKEDDQLRYVHYNLLDGQLLVDGKTLSGLPKSILRNPLYRWIFPNRPTAEIVPSTLKGMSYQLARNVNSTLEVHFEDGKDLIVRVRDIANDGATSEFVENTRLRGDFPNRVLHDTIILYCDATDNNSNSLMFFERSSAGWNAQNALLWEMKFSGDPLLQSPEPTLTSTPSDLQHSSKKQTILSPHSKLVLNLFAILNRLESSPVELYVLSESNGTCLPRCPTSCLIVTLPRYSLTFFLNSSLRFECKELSNMVIAGTQTVGTLIGLRNQLVLEDARYPVNKKILIPYGDVRAQQNSGQICRVIHPFFDDNHIRFFVYELDHVLQRLTSTETLASLYYLIYLHAMTSYHLPDPLTGRLGTEQALWMLKSNGSFAFMEPLKDIESKILRRLQDIAPERHYYPEHLTSMESTTWRADIPILAQNDLFVPFVDAIFEHNEDLKMFLDYSKPSAPSGSDPLRQRSQVRTSRITAPEFCDQVVSEIDERYEVPLTSSQLVDSQKRLIRIATSVKGWTLLLEALPNLWSIFCSLEPFMARAEALDFSEVDSLFETSIRPNEVWFGLFYECCTTKVKEEHYYDLLFTFSIMAYRSERNMDVLHLLLAMASQAMIRGPDFCQVPSYLANIPNSVYFTPRSEGPTISKNQLQELVRFRNFEVGLLSRGSTESDYAYWNRCRQYYDQTCAEQRMEFVDIVYRSELPHPSFPSESQSACLNLIDHASSRSEIEMKFRSWTRNLCLYEYCSGLEQLFQKITLPTSVKDDELWSWFPSHVQHFTEASPRFGIPTLLSLIKDRQSSYQNKDLEKTVQVSDTLTTRDLVTKLQSLETSENLLQVYCDDLSKCIDALSPKKLHYDASLDTLKRLLNPRNASEELLSNAGLWPIIHPMSLLRQLTYRLRDRVKQYSVDWLSLLTKFGEGLKRRQSENRKEQLRENSAAGSYQGGQWKSSEYLDWLLLELDADISIRPVQVNIAKQMMSPAGDINTVMQLNMGEGKSSVIIPMVSTALADGKQLVRVIVLKPLCSQMFALLRQRVSGLANRRLYFFPFHRNVRLDTSQIQKIFKLFQTCVENAGILLCQPEHILSFRLIGLERLCNSDEHSSLLDTQRWLDDNSRDLLDESDELLSTRYQLIYTIGTPSPLDGQPDRWEITQRVFTLVHDILGKLQAEYEYGLEVSETTEMGRFPRLRLLTNECARGLVEQLAREIVYNERLPWLRLRNYTAQDRQDAFEFITSPAVNETKYAELKDTFPYNFPHLLLLRGLLALGILVNVFKEKRWRVDYGLDHSRCLVAVPYRAKDYPSLRAEFGHPEMIIALTCLSYYYGGLGDKEMTRVFEILLQLDNPDLHYQDWIMDQIDEIPSHLRTLRGLNLEDAEQQHMLIFPRLRYIKAVIDFYLSHAVFPREAKEFPYKLTTNSWDLAMEKARVTTGFSGTNDHRYLLPLSIKQNDSPDQKHTNALVLEYILRPENRRVIKTGANPSAMSLLELVVQFESQILIDAGAQVLELDNGEVAKKWLSLEKRQHIEAAIYCDMKDEEFKVISRTGRVETLQNSSYKSQLEKTIVYLDEARTRGTDMKFPLKSAAVVTLGPKLAKDKLMQACMRMRQLGRGHSVMFFASDEIIQKIQELSPDVDPDSLNSSHVLIWSMHETFLQLKNNTQHWGIQGLNYSARREAWRDFLELGSVDEFSASIMEKEAKTLEELYGLNRDFGINPDDSYFHDIVQRSKDYGISLSTMNNIAEEQERELAHEKEEEREVERAQRVEPARHAVDPALYSFLNMGRPDVYKLQTLADGLKFTSSISNLEEATNEFFQSPEIRCTLDFMRTIRLSSPSERGAMDDFLRPVQWILSSTAAPNFLCVISPYEANKLFPLIRGSKVIQLHCYTARVSRQGKSTEALDRFLLSKVERNIPNLSWTPIMIQELNLFSGQLFFRDQETFESVCRMLGLHLGAVPSDLEGKIEVTGFVKDLDLRRRLSMTECKFSADPVHFLQDLFSWRCKGQGYSMTHVWKLLHGRNVETREF